MSLIIHNVILSSNRLDPDTKAFIDAVRANDIVGKWKAVDEFVRAAKLIGFWDTTQAYWPYYGGTAEAHAVNLFNPAQYGLVHVGSPSHNANGCQYNTTTQYSYSSFNPATNMAINNTTIGVYNGVELGVVTNRFLISAYQSGTVRYELFHSNTSYTSRSYTNALSATMPNGGITTGLVLHTRRSATNARIFWRGTGGTVNTTNSGSTLPNTPIMISAWDYNAPQYFSGMRSQSAFALKSLTDAKAVDFTNAVNDFQTKLNRFVA